MTDPALRQLAQLITEVTEGAVPPSYIEATTDNTLTLVDAGVTSVQFLQLLDRIETDYDIFIDLDIEPTDLRTVHGLAKLIQSANDAR